MPIDIKSLRADQGGDPEAVKKSQSRRFADEAVVDLLIDMDTRWRSLRGKLDDLARERNTIQKEIQALRKAGKDAKEKQDKIKSIGEDVKTSQANVKVLEEQIAKLLPKVGNVVASDVPTSNNEDDNEIVRTFGSCRTGKELLHHHEVLFRLGGYEPDRGVGVAGHRAYFLRDSGLLLNQALISYSIAFLRKRGYTMLQPPYFMNKDVMAGVAQLEQFDEELYKVTGSGIDEKYLIATSEQPLCGYHKGEWMEESKLPKRYGGVSTCFRKEAGAHGKDTWGIFRVHQFDKIEQFCITEGDIEKSQKMHEEMLTVAEEFLQSLGLSYRTVNIVSGELNNSAAKKYDIEAWFPAYEEYRELVSCSNCTDYQSRSMEIRSGVKKMGQTEKKYAHLLNATLCACTRTLSCIIENFQTKDGVVVPDVLVPYIGGLEFLPFERELPKDRKESHGATKEGLPVKQEKKIPQKCQSQQNQKASAPQNVTKKEPETSGANLPPKQTGKKDEAPSKQAEKITSVDSKPSSLLAVPIPLPAENFWKNGELLVDKLQSHLQEFSYIAGWTPGRVDAEAYSALTASGNKLPEGSITRWAKHISSFSEADCSSWA
eukprot:18910_1